MRPGSVGRTGSGRGLEDMVSLQQQLQEMRDKVRWRVKTMRGGAYEMIGRPVNKGVQLIL